MTIFRRILVVAATAIVVAVAITAPIIAHVNRFAAPYEYQYAYSIPDRPVAIVFGAYVYPNKSLSSILADIVQAAVDLYRAGRVKKILMTGDNSRKVYDEPTAMKTYAMSHGVPSKDIVLDYAGFDTYDSCYRAIHIFEVKRAILVTQTYHDHRAIMIARRLGMDAVGLDLPDWSKYPDLRIPCETREWAADVKAEWQLNVTHPRPKFLGPKLPIS